MNRIQFIVTNGPTLRRPCLRRSVLITCGALLLVLTLSAVSWAQNRSVKPPAAKPSPSILLENRTYTPLWYRTRNGQAWSDWMALIPGERHRYSQAQLTLEASLEGRVQSFPLVRSNTYCYRRTSPQGSASFVCDEDDRGLGRWHVPRPPSAQEFAAASKNNRSPTALFAPLEKFLDRCEQAGDEHKLSLRDFTKACRQAYERDGSLPEDLKYVQGFTWFFGFLIDTENSDVVLLGVKDACRPPLDVDCLATAIRAVQAGQIPVASLENDPDNKEHVKSAIDGVPWATRWSEIMIDADYTMKKLSLGLISPRIKGLRSEFEHAYLDVRRNPENYKDAEKITAFCSRRWFNFDNTADRAAVSDDGQVAVLYRNPIRLSSELHLDGKYGSGRTAPTAEAFVRDFNQHFDLLGRHYPSLARLQALYRVFDLFSHIRDIGGRGPVASAFWVQTYESPYEGPPVTLPTFNKEGSFKWEDGDTTWTWTPSITGGVEMQLKASELIQHRDAFDPRLKARLLSP